MGFTPRHGFKMDNARTGVAAAAVAMILLTALVGGVLAWNPVEEGNVEVVKEWGDSTGEMLEPGAHWITPIKDSTAVVKTRPQQYTMANEAAEGAEARDDSVEVLTNDGVSVDVDVTVRYRVDTAQANTFYDEYKNVRQAEARLIRPTTQDVLRTEGGDIQTTQIYTGSGQNQMADAVTEALIAESEGTGLTIEAVQIRNIKLPSQYADAVEKKEVEKQNIEKKQNSIEVAKAEAERKRVEAQGQADANEIEAESLKGNPELVQVKYINALESNENTIYVGAGSQAGIDLVKNVDEEEGEQG
ncbi:prohibitin family protein [Halorubrum sp. Boch-26]|uniref:prohibitin family protein n=1 Tax=Halorubrum sp. Boch-26 TaxID=2994426 RepID=UPI0024692F55|nr:prohibitin family protein [Halorubrum sp. Boch-26]